MNKGDEEERKQRCKTEKKKKERKIYVRRRGEGRKEFFSMKQN